MTLELLHLLDLVKTYEDFRKLDFHMLVEMFRAVLSYKIVSSFAVAVGPVTGQLLSIQDIEISEGTN